MIVLSQDNLVMRAIFDLRAKIKIYARRAQIQKNNGSDYCQMGDNQNHFSYFSLAFIDGINAVFIMDF